METERQKTYHKQYYDTNKNRIIEQIKGRRKLIRNSDKYIEDNRDGLIEALDKGTKKFIQLRTLAKYKINIDPKTLQYYHNKDNTSYYNKEIYETLTNITENVNITMTSENSSLNENMQQEQEQPEQPQQEQQQDSQQDEQQDSQQDEQPDSQQDNQQDEQPKQPEQQQPDNQQDEQPDSQQDEQPDSQQDEQPKQPEQQPDEQQDSQQEDSQEDEEQNDNITVDVLRSILEQSEIGENDKTRILTYPHKKRNKNKRVLIRQIRDRFKF